MFVREKFVTNSSSSSFLCYGIYLEKFKDADLIRRAWLKDVLSDNQKEYYFNIYGKKTHTDKKSGETITKEFDLSNHNDQEAFFEEISRRVDMEVLISKYASVPMEWNYEPSMLVAGPCNFRLDDYEIKEIKLPDATEMLHIETVLKDLVNLLYGDLDEKDRPSIKWLMGTTYG